MFGEIVIGSLTTPLSKRFTLATSAPCCLGVMFLCTMPMPPSWASAMARRDSVTVSMAADSSGIFSWMVRVSRVVRLTSRGRTVEWAGTRRTSSKVSAFWMTRMQNLDAKRDYIGWALPRQPNQRPARCVRAFIDADGLGGYGFFKFLKLGAVAQCCLAS